MIDIIKASARGEYDEALVLARKHLESISKEEKNAEEAIEIVENNLLKEILDGYRFDRNFLYVAHFLISNIFQYVIQND